MQDELPSKDVVSVQPGMGWKGERTVFETSRKVRPHKKDSVASFLTLLHYYKSSISWRRREEQRNVGCSAKLVSRQPRRDLRHTSPPEDELDVQEHGEEGVPSEH